MLDEFPNPGSTVVSTTAEKVFCILLAFFCLVFSINYLLRDASAIPCTPWVIVK